MPTKHADMSPSRLARILACPASYRETAGMPSPEPSSYAQEGSMLHEVVAEVIDVNNEDQMDGLTAEQRGLVGECVSYLAHLVSTLGHNNYTISIERRVSLDAWGIPEVYGTADVILHDLQNSHLHVIDWKFGQGVLVDAYENPQLLAYGAGAISWPAKADGVTMHVFQPRLEHTSRYSVTAHEMYQWVHGVLALGVLAAKSPNAPFNPGESQCRWCDINATCKARSEHANTVAMAVFKQGPMNPNRVDIETLIKIHQQAGFITQYLKDIHAFLHEEAERGRPIPGYKLVEGRANRIFSNPDAVTKYLVDVLKLDPEDIYDTKIKSPAQLEKAFKGLKKDKKFQDLIVKPKGKVTLVPDHDAREAITANRSVQAFADLFDDDQNLAKLE